MPKRGKEDKMQGGGSANKYERGIGKGDKMRGGVAKEIEWGMPERGKDDKIGWGGVAKEN